jgi:hypothetical protein
MATEQSSFEAALEADLRELAQEIKNQRERPEMQNAGEKEIIKEAIRAFPQSEKHPAPVPPSGAGSSTASPLPAYAQTAPAEVRLEIEYLLDIALRQGLGKALGEAQKAPYFVVDAFRDALAGRLYPELQKRGIVK